MPACSSKNESNNRICGSLLYKCKNCGAVGCHINGCKNQKFRNGTCMACGRAGTMEPLKW